MSNQCKKCLSVVDRTDAFCRNCGTPVSRNKPKISVETGEDSTNIGVGYLPNANIHIGNRYESNNQEPIASIDRNSIQPLKIGESKVKISWLIISGIIGFLGSIASILSYWQSIFSINTPPPPAFLMNSLIVIQILSAIILLLGFFLHKDRFVNLLVTNIEADKNGNLYLTKVGGICPKCGSKLKLSNVGPKDHKILMVVCCRNPSQHRWGFDSTVLPDLENSSITWQKL